MSNQYAFVLCTIVAAIFRKSKTFDIRKTISYGEKPLNAFKSLKDKLVSAALQIIDKNVPFVVETDASDNAISASLNQHD